MPEPVSDLNRNQEVGYYGSGGNFYVNEDPLDINVRNLENLSLMDNFSSALGGIETSDTLEYFHDFDAVLNPYIDDPKEGNISRTVRVPSSEHVAEIVGRQGCKIKDLRARTNTYIKTPMRTQSPVFVVTGKEDAVLLVMGEIQSAAEHFTHIRASRNHHKVAGGLDTNKPVSKEGDIMIQVTVPYRVVGLVVGLKGQTIKAIQQDTDTFIVTPNRDKAPIFEIRGQPENVERAKMMILRHIETRTRHCRLQDTTNLSNNWNDEPRQNGNDYSFYHGDILPQNGNNSSCGMSINSNFSSKGSAPNGNSSSSQGTGFSFSSTSPPTTVNYNWRSYGNILDQPQNGHLTAWSNATSDFSPILGNGTGLSSGANIIGNSRNGNNFQYSMSLGSIPSSSNSSASISPPHDFLNDGPFSSHNPFGPSLSSPSLRSMNDQDSFPTFPLLTTASSTSTKGSLVLGNLFQSQSNVTSSLSMSLMSCNEGIHGFPGSLQDDRVGYGGHLSCSSLGSFSGTIGESNMFTGQMNGFPSGNSSPTSKSCSLSDTSGSQGSPTPRLCKVCEEAEVVAALVPCGHNLFCMECAEGIINKAAESERRCPACKEPAGDVLRIRA
ncbi:RNA-binding protein MEX3B-like isoform X2 [Physella acuta]|uniref:RNA-binding protein MEX3B-like isoform X2 n=1 Tax=Physella acuta TaxID=109671 RepID=UPI0027DC2A08|nr:RNA-binding protein MEX3B-like isoform X2 [Physella acuta]